MSDAPWAHDKIVVVTGGASGIGAALCRRFASEGAHKVVVVDMNFDAAQAVAVEIDGVAMAANCGQEMDLRKVVMRVEFEVGEIDVWCSNAGIPSNGGLDVPDDEWQRIWKVNTMQHVFAARHLFPLFEARGGGAFLITASAAGLLSQVGSLPYSVTKHAAVSIAEWLAITYGDKGIDVSCLCPQAVESGMTAGADGGGVAGGDGVLSAEQVAADVLAAMAAKAFLVTPHPEVRKYIVRKATDPDRWIKGMTRMHEQFGTLMLRAPPMSAAKL